MRITRATVHVPIGDNEVVTLQAGETIPEELEEFITNPKAYTELVEIDALGESADPGTPGYADQKVEDLKALLKERELPQDGNKPELIARLLEADEEAKNNPPE